MAVFAKLIEIFTYIHNIDLTGKFASKSSGGSPRVRNNIIVPCILGTGAHTHSKVGIKKEGFPS